MNQRTEALPVKTDGKKCKIMKKNILTPKRAQEIQDEIFKKMTAEQKIKLVSSFFRLGRKLNKLNGNRRSFDKNNRHIG